MGDLNWEKEKQFRLKIERTIDRLKSDITKVEEWFAGGSTSDAICDSMSISEDALVLQGLLEDYERWEDSK